VQLHRSQALVLALAAATIVGACSGAGTSTSGGGSGGSGGNAGGGTANPTGIVRYGYDLSAMFTNTFDPEKSNGDCDAIPVQLIYDTLLHRDASGKLNPGTALSVTLNGRDITIKLRPNVKFSDGEPFDSAAVKTSLLRNAKNSQLTSLAPIASIDTPDPLTLVVHYKDDTGVEFVNAMAGRDGWIVAPQHLNDADKHPIGVGPFVLFGYQPGSTISLRANPNYWDKGRYKIGGIDFVQVGVGPPSLTALRAGNIDMVNVDADGFTQLHTAPGFGVAAQETTAYLQFQFRFVKPFDLTPQGKLVRQAINYALKRDDINRVVESGAGEVASQEFPKASQAYDPALANLYPYDPVKARQLLAEAGYPNGLTIDVAIPGGNISEMERQAAIVQQQLAAVGIKMNIIRVLGSDIATQYYIAGNGVAFLAARLGSFYPPDQVYSAYGNGQFVAIWNKGELQNITDLSTQAFKLGVTQPAMDLAKQADDYVMQNALEAPIVFRPEFMAYSNSRLGGTVHAQTDICDPANLAELFVKK
jgi:peptide/nickel transport system substrate-binding protein